MRLGGWSSFVVMWLFVAGVIDCGRGTRLGRASRQKKGNTRRTRLAERRARRRRCRRFGDRRSTRARRRASFGPSPGRRPPSPPHAQPCDTTIPHPSNPTLAPRAPLGSADKRTKQPRRLPPAKALPSPPLFHISGPLCRAARRHTAAKAPEKKSSSARLPRLLLPPAVAPRASRGIERDSEREAESERGRATSSASVIASSRFRAKDPFPAARNAQDNEADPLRDRRAPHARPDGARATRRAPGKRTGRHPSAPSPPLFSLGNERRRERASVPLIPLAPRRPTRS